MKQRKLSKETLSLRQTLDVLVASQGTQAFSVRDLDAMLKLRGISVDTRSIGNDLMRRERLHWLTSEIGESQGERGRPCRMYKLIQARYEWLARQKGSTNKVDDSHSGAKLCLCNGMPHMQFNFISGVLSCIKGICSTQKGFGGTCHDATL